jgi:hypothetical protein
MIVTTTPAIGSPPAIRSCNKEPVMTTTHRAATSALLVLALAAASAPTAGARPADFTPAAKQPATAVYSRPDKSLIPASQTATSGAAAGRAALVRSSAQQERQRVAALSAYRAGQLAAALDVAAPAANKASAPQAVVRVQPPQSGFDWGDAGIGAAGGLTLAMLGLGGGLVISHQRPRRTRRSTALPS